MEKLNDELKNKHTYILNGNGNATNNAMVLNRNSKVLPETNQRPELNDVMLMALGLSRSFSKQFFRFTHDTAQAWPNVN